MQKPICCFITFFCLFCSAHSQLPSGAVAMYHLDNNSAVDDGSNGYNGSLSSTSATTNRFGVSNTAVSFSSGSSTGQLPAALVSSLQNDFSIGYWFQTSMIANSSGQWYGGNAMVDAEVCGVTTDWGTALIDGGKVCFGIGAPDLTIKSTSDYNDGNWHFVTAVRDQAAGSITLYVDGSRVATTSSTTTSSLTAPGFLGLGKNPCNSSAVFNGALDDIIAYNRALSPTEVSHLYNALNLFPLPLHWLSFIGESQADQIKLKWEIAQPVNNDHFEIEHSGDGMHFSGIASVTAGDGVSEGGGRFVYTYIDNDPAEGIHFYRIKQVDEDGRFSYSNTIKITFNHIAGNPHLKFNPVHDQLTIINPAQQNIQQLVIMDISGKMIKQKNINSSAAVINYNVPGLPQGLYILQLKGVSGNFLSKFIKQ